MEEKSKLVDFVILDKKIISGGAIHGLISRGGEIVLEKNFGLRMVPKGKWVEIQFVAYSEKPSFKMNYGLKKVKSKPKQEDTQLKIDGEVNIFDI
jgi:hypothetical protein